MRLDLPVGLLATLLLCGPSAAQNNAAATPSTSGNWRLVGPTAAEPMKDAHGGDVGRINTFAFHPTQPNMIYAASPSGGLCVNRLGMGTPYRRPKGTPPEQQAASERAPIAP